MRRALFLSCSLLVACDGGDEPLDAGAPDSGGADAGAIGATIDPGDLPLEGDPSGEWLAGDLHVHATDASNDTGGDSFPEDIKRVAMERGLYFVVLTDHSNSTGSDPSTRDEDPTLFNMGPEFPYWDEAARLSEAGVFLMIDGNELSPVAEGDMPSDPTGHVGCVPADLASFDRSGAITDRPKGTVTGAETLTQARDRGCFVVLNHPWGTPWISFDWTSFDYDAMEIWNGTAGYDEGDENGVNAWRCDLLSGRAVAGIGASDNHRVLTEPPGDPLNPALGFPSTLVFAADRTWPAIVEGLRAGTTAIGEGGSQVVLDGYAADGARSRSAIRYVRLRGRVSSDSRAAALTLTRATACQDTRAADRAPPTITDETLLVRAIATGEAFDLVVEVEGTGVYTATLGHSRGHYGAISNPLVVE